MMSFNLKERIAKHSQKNLNIARKTDLLDLATHYEISDIKMSRRKQIINKTGLIGHLGIREQF